MHGTTYQQSKTTFPHKLGAEKRFLYAVCLFYSATFKNNLPVVARQNKIKSAQKE